MENSKTALAKYLASLIIFGTIGIFVHYVGLPSGMIALVRAFIGFLVLISFTFIKKDKISFASIKKNIVYLLVSGVSLGFSWLLLFEAYKYTSVSTATLCYYMAPMFIMIISPFVFSEKLGVKKIICILLSFCGMIFVSGIINNGFSGIRGILSGLGSAVLYTVIVTMNKKMSDIKPIDKTICQFLVAAAVLLPYCLLTIKFSELQINPTKIILLLVLGIVHSGFAYVLYFGSVAELKSQTVAIVSYVDPALALVLSALILKETPGVLGILGAVLIIGSAIISEIHLKKPHKSRTEQSTNIHS
jgi:RarD protein